MEGEGEGREGRETELSLSAFIRLGKFKLATQKPAPLLPIALSFSLDHKQDELIFPRYV